MFHVRLSTQWLARSWSRPSPLSLSSVTFEKRNSRCYWGGCTYRGICFFLGAAVTIKRERLEFTRTADQLMDAARKVRMELFAARPSEFAVGNMVRETRRYNWWGKGRGWTYQGCVRNENYIRGGVFVERFDRAALLRDICSGGYPLRAVTHYLVNKSAPPRDICKKIAPLRMDYSCAVETVKSCFSTERFDPLLRHFVPTP